MIKKIIAAIILLVVSGCSVEYSRLNNQVKKSITPDQIIKTGVDIGFADISDEQKNKLYKKLTKRALNIFRLYIEFVVSGEKLPNKDEVLDMIKFLGNNIDKLNNDKLIEQAKYLIEKLSLVLVDTYLK